MLSISLTLTRDSTHQDIALAHQIIDMFGAEAVAVDAADQALAQAHNAALLSMPSLEQQLADDQRRDLGSASTVPFGQGANGNAPYTAGASVPVIAQPVSEASSVPQFIAAQPTTSTATADAPSVDSRGFPWDARIHASSKALNADGTWRYKRGVNDRIVAQVEASFTAAPGTPAAPPPPPPATVTRLHGDLAPAAPAPAAPAPAAPAPAAPAPAAPAPAALSPSEFMRQAASLIVNSGGKLTTTQANEMCQRASVLYNVRVASLADVAGKPELHEYVLGEMRNACGVE